MTILSGKVLITAHFASLLIRHVPVVVYGVKMILPFCHDPLIQEKAFSGRRKTA
jgi:hypothetical protein